MYNKYPILTNEILWLPNMWMISRMRWKNIKSRKKMINLYKKQWIWYTRTSFQLDIVDNEK